MEKRLFPVKVMDAQGKIKYEVKEEELKTRHWVIYENMTRLYKKGSQLDYIFAKPPPPGAPNDYFK